jgi:nucleotide-binding universal stress UspA family protein
VLAMGHGRGRSHHLFVGSVTSKILHGSQVPVLVVPHHAGAIAHR